MAGNSNYFRFWFDWWLIVLPTRRRFQLCDGAELNDYKRLGAGVLIEVVFVGTACRPTPDIDFVRLRSNQFILSGWFSLSLHGSLQLDALFFVFYQGKVFICLRRPRQQRFYNIGMPCRTICVASCRDAKSCRLT